MEEVSHESHRTRQATRSPARNRSAHRRAACGKRRPGRRDVRMAPHRHRDDARLVRRVRRGPGRVRGPARRACPHPGGGGYRHRPEQGHPGARQAPCRRDLRDRQHLPEPCAGRGHPGAVPLADAGVRAGGVPDRPLVPGSARGLRRRVPELPRRLLRGGRAAAARGPGRPDRSGLPRPHRGAEPGHLVARTGLPDGDGRPLRRPRLPGLLAVAGRQRRAGRQRLGERLLRGVHGLRRTGAAPDRRLLRLQSAVRGAVCGVADGRAAHRRGYRSAVVLPADRVRRHPGRRGEPRPGRALGRLHAVANVPGGPAAEHVRVPGQRRCRPAEGVRGLSCGA